MKKKKKNCYFNQHIQNRKVIYLAALRGGKKKDYPHR